MVCKGVAGVNNRVIVNSPIPPSALMHNPKVGMALKRRKWSARARSQNLEEIVDFSGWAKRVLRLGLGSESGSGFGLRLGSGSRSGSG